MLIHADERRFPKSGIRAEVTRQDSKRGKEKPRRLREKKKEEWGLNDAKKKTDFCPSLKSEISIVKLVNRFLSAMNTGRFSFRGHFKLEPYLLE